MKGGNRTGAKRLRALKQTAERGEAGSYLPTPEQIEDECAKIRAGWQVKTERRGRPLGCHHPPFEELEDEE